SDVALVYNLFFGVPTGPSLFVSAAPALPAGANVTFTIDSSKVRAKDGKSLFTGGGLLGSGILSLATNAFGASIAVPVAPPPPPPDLDGGADDGGADAGVSPDADSTDGGAPDAGDDAMSMADAGMVCVPPPPPPAPEDVPPSADPITITFNNPVTKAD